MIGEANRRGGLDNITAVVVQVTALDDPRLDSPTAETPVYRPPEKMTVMADETVGAVADLYLGNILLYALELAATSLETVGKREDAGFYRGIARKSRRCARAGDQSWEGVGG